MNRRHGVLRKMKIFFKASWKVKWLALQTFCLCGIVRALLLCVSFNKIQPYLGTHNKESSQTVELEQYRTAKQIKWIVEAVSSYTPWQSKCLVQAIVAQYLLKKRGIATTLYLGVCKSKQEFKAHAWLRCGGMCITGEGARNAYKEISKFSNEESVRSNIG